MVGVHSELMRQFYLDKSTAYRVLAIMVEKYHIDLAACNQREFTMVAREALKEIPNV